MVADSLRDLRDRRMKIMSAMRLIIPTIPPTVAPAMLPVDRTVLLASLLLVRGGGGGVSAALVEDGDGVGDAYEDTGDDEELPSHSMRGGWAANPSIGCAYA